MENKSKYRKYYTEVIAKLKTEIAKLEARIIKAEELGADKSEHKFYKNYLEVKAEWNKQNDFLTEYNLKLENLNNVQVRPNEIKENIPAKEPMDMDSYETAVKLFSE
jgi:hypothetical protein